MSDIIFKRSSVPSKVPLATDLQYGEVALNYADGRLYYKKSDNTIDYLGSGSLTGVLINSPQDGEVLTYETSSGKWKNKSAGTAAATDAAIAMAIALG